MVKNLIKKNYLLIEFGTYGSHDWLKNPNLAAICGDTRIIMQEPKRFEFKIIELVDSIERHIADVKVDKQLEEQPPDVFISYCWKNSRDAIKKGTKTNSSSLG